MVSESSPLAMQPRLQLPVDKEFDYMAETQWSALCAVLKEDILDVSQEKSDDNKVIKARLVVFNVFCLCTLTVTVL